MAMNSTKKILYSVAALLIVGGLAFLLSQKDTLLGSFTAMTGTHTTPTVNTIISTTSIEDAAIQAALEATNAQTYASAASTDAVDAGDAWMANDRNALSSAQSAATSDGDNAKTAGDNASTYASQAQAFYDADYTTYQSDKTVMNDAETGLNLAYGFYYAMIYQADAAKVDWENAVAVAIAEEGTVVSGGTNNPDRTIHTVNGFYSTDLADFKDTFDTCMAADVYNETNTLSSSKCVETYESTLGWSSIDSTSVSNSTISSLKTTYNNAYSSEAPLKTAYDNASDTYIDAAAVVRTDNEKLDTDEVSLNAALASADEAASSASQGLSSKNLAASYQFLSCTGLTLNPDSHEMLSTDTSAAFNLTASVNTSDATSAYKFSLKNLMTFALGGFNTDTSIRESISTYPVQTYDAQTKWFGTLVFKSNDASATVAGSFKIGPKTGNPLELNKTDATDTTVAFSGGAVGDTIRVYVKNEQDSCSQSFAITQAGAVTPAGTTLTESSSSTALTEGSTTTDSYTIALNTAPTANVSITVTPDAQITVSPSTLTFTSSNWNVAQTVTVTAVNDTTIEGTHNGVIKHTVSSTDTSYNGLSLSSVTATMTDNDTAGATLTESSSSTALTEGSTTTDSYTVALNTAPTSDVTITVTPDTQITVTPSTLTFTSSNWASSQNVTVTAINDTSVEGTHSGVIKHTVSSTDSNYSGLSLSSVTATITDNDTNTDSGSNSGSVSTSTSCGTTLPFLDVATDNFAYDYINQLYCTGVVQGRSTTLFVPDGTNGYVTYAELVKMIDIALLKKTSSDGTNLTVSFSNVDTNDWFRNYWAIAEDARVVRSYDSFAYTIDPNANIPREVVALYVARALGATATNFTAPFSDVTDLTDPYAYAIYALSHLSVTVDGVSTTVITGADSTHFNPTDFISRSEAATIVYRASLSDLAQ